MRWPVIPSAMATASPRLAAEPRTMSNRFLSGTVMSGYGLRYAIGSGIIVVGRGNEHGSNCFEWCGGRRAPPWGPGVRPVDVPVVVSRLPGGQFRGRGGAALVDRVSARWRHADHRAAGPPANRAQREVAAECS